MKDLPLVKQLQQKVADFNANYNILAEDKAAPTSPSPSPSLSLEALVQQKVD